LTSKYEPETNLENEPTQYPGQPVPVSSEAAYDRLSCYGFARRYVGGKIVADIGREGVGYGSRLLAQIAESVTTVTSSLETVELATTLYSAPNVSYRSVDLPKLPFSEGHFDVVVAFGVIESLEHPEDLVTETERVLKEGGVLIISALDKQTNANDRNRRSADGQREMYGSEFRELLERHFGHVRVYRQGAVAGGFVFPASEEITGTPVESAQVSLANPHIGVEPPATRSVIAVCSDDAEALGQEERPYLLLDRDRCVFDESEERAEDVELMRGEIRRMQETEVQAFVDAIKVRHSLAQELPRYLPHLRNLTVEHMNLTVEHILHLRNLLLEDIIHTRNIIRGNIYAIRQKGVRGIVSGGFRRSSALYRRLKTKNRGSD
jgi:SAM-dependent methyltransferase